MDYQKYKKTAQSFLVYLFLVPSVIGIGASLILHDVDISVVAILGGLFICLIANVIVAIVKGKLIVRESYQLGVVSVAENPFSFFINLGVYLFLIIIMGLIVVGSVMRYSS